MPPREVKQLSSSHTAPERPERIRNPDRPAAMSLSLPRILSFRICKMGAAAGTVGAILRVSGGKGTRGPGVRLGAVMGDLMPVWAMSPLGQPSGKLEVGGPPLPPIPHEDDPWEGTVIQPLRVQPSCPGLGGGGGGNQHTPVKTHDTSGGMCPHFTDEKTKALSGGRITGSPHTAGGWGACARIPTSGAQAS